MEFLSSINQPNLILLMCSITDIIWDFIPLFTAADYLNMTVSNKKAFATLDTVHKWTLRLLVNYYLSATSFSYLRTLMKISYIVWNKELNWIVTTVFFNIATLGCPKVRRCESSHVTFRLLFLGWRQMKARATLFRCMTCDLTMFCCLLDRQSKIIALAIQLDFSPNITHSQWS